MFLSLQKLQDGLSFASRDRDSPLWNMLQTLLLYQRRVLAHTIWKLPDGIGLRNLQRFIYNDSK